MTVASLNFWAFCDVHPILGSVYLAAILFTVALCSEHITHWRKP